MKYTAFVFIATLLSMTIAAHAQDSLVNVQQMDPDSVPKQQAVVPPPAPKDAPAEPAHSMADDLKQVLQDYKISKLGRANKAVSSQYDSQPIINDQSAASVDTSKMVEKDARQTKAQSKKNTKKQNDSDSYHDEDAIGADGQKTPSNNK